MRSIFAYPLVFLPAGLAVRDLRGESFNVLLARQDNLDIPCGKTAPANDPNFCAIACGQGKRACPPAGPRHCYDHDGGDKCCADGRVCNSNSYCSNKGCCLNGQSLEECGATVTLHTTYGGPEIATSPTGSPSDHGQSSPTGLQPPVGYGSSSSTPSGPSPYSPPTSSWSTSSGPPPYSPPTSSSSTPPGSPPYSPTAPSSSTPASPPPYSPTCHSDTTSAAPPGYTPGATDTTCTTKGPSSSTSTTPQSPGSPIGYSPPPSYSSPSGDATPSGYSTASGYSSPSSYSSPSGYVPPPGHSSPTISSWTGAPTNPPVYTTDSWSSTATPPGSPVTPPISSYSINGTYYPAPPQTANAGSKIEVLGWAFGSLSTLAWAFFL